MLFAVGVETIPCEVETFPHTR